MSEIVICKQCGNKEFWDKMTWLSGSSYCRDCYKHNYGVLYGEAYKWPDKEYTPEEIEVLSRGEEEEHDA